MADLGKTNEFQADSFDHQAGKDVSINWEAGSFEANGIVIHFYHTLPDLPLPTLVFLHGLSASGATLIPLLSDLAADFRIVLPDARAHGKSQPIPHESFTVASLIIDAASVIRHVSPNHPVFLGGHSMGAATAARIAKEHPSLVRAVVLEDPPWLRLAGQPVDPAEYQNSPLPRCKELQAMPDEVFSRLNTPLPAGSDPLAITMFESQRLVDVDAIQPTFRETDDYLFNEAVEGIQMPVLLQSGTPTAGAILRPWVAELCLASYPQGKEQNFPGAPHVIHSHCPKTWLENMRSFLKLQPA